jgi:hypothetical protein
MPKVLVRRIKYHNLLAHGLEVSEAVVRSCNPRGLMCGVGYSSRTSEKALVQKDIFVLLSGFVNPRDEREDISKSFRIKENQYARH